MRRLASSLSIALVLLASRASAQAPPRWAAAIDSMMARELARTGTPGAQIAVVEHGRLAYTRGYGVADIETGRPVTERTLFQVGSVTKLFTAVLIAQMASDGALDVRAPVSRWAPELAGRAVGGTTLHALLTHTAGLGPGGIPYGRSDDAAANEFFSTIGDTALVPGLTGLYYYSNPGFSMAGWVAERAAHRPYETLLDSIVLRPLGMTRSTHRPMLAMTQDFSLGHSSPRGAARMQTGTATQGPSPVVTRPMPGNSAEWGAGFLYTSAGESARLAIAMMDGGMIEGRRALSPEAVRLVTSAYVMRAGFPGDSSGYGMYTNTLGGRRTWQKGGSVEGYRALLTMWPQEKLAIVILTNRLSDVTIEATAQAAQIVAGIAPRVVPPVAEREPTAAERAALIGMYRIRYRSIEIREANGRLEFKRGNYAVPIRMTGADRFVVTPPNDETLTYFVIRDASGAVQRLESPEASYPRIAKP